MAVPARHAHLLNFNEVYGSGVPKQRSVYPKSDVGEIDPEIERFLAVVVK